MRVRFLFIFFSDVIVVFIKVFGLFLNLIKYGWSEMKEWINELLNNIEIMFWNYGW